MRVAPLTILVLGAIATLVAIARLRSGHAASSPATGDAPTTSEPSAPGAPTPGGFVARSYTEAGVTYRYQIFFPHDYDVTRRWPTIVSLHGSGEKGSDGAAPTRQGLGSYVRRHAATFPAVVVFPQVPLGMGAPGFYGAIRRLVDSALHEVNADPKRLYLTGFSSGGVMAYNLVHAEPGKYAALVPVGSVVTLLAGPNASMLPKPEAYVAAAKGLASAPVWIFHGGRDDMAGPSYAREAKQGLEAAGATVRYTEFPDGGHDVRDQVYATPELWSWLFAQHR